MKIKLLTSTLALLIAQSSLAASGNDPFTCPSVDTLKSIGVSSISKDDDLPSNEWLGVELSNRYGTNDYWTFAIGGFEGKDRSEILAKANAAISTLTLEGGPFLSRRGENTEWVCDYASSDGSAKFAVAITPPLNLNAAGLSKLMRK